MGQETQIGVIALFVPDIGTGAVEGVADGAPCLVRRTPRRSDGQPPFARARDPGQILGQFAAERRCHLIDRVVAAQQHRKEGARQMCHPAGEGFARGGKRLSVHAVH